jgi:ribonuclease P protein component
MLAKRYRLTTSFFGASASSKKTAFISRQLKELNLKTFSSFLPYSRFAVVASSSAFKKASERNKYRRAVYESIRKSGANKESGKDIVIYLKSDIKKITAKEVEKLIGRLLKK